MSRTLARDATAMSFLPTSFSELLANLFKRSMGGLLFALTTCILVAALRYHPSDPSLNAATGGPVQNPLGLPGAIVADTLIQTLGLGFLFLILPPAVWGFAIALGKRIQAFLPLSVLTICSALGWSVVLNAVPTPDSWPLEGLGLGGAAGVMLNGWLYDLLPDSSASWPDFARHLAILLPITLISVTGTILALGVGAAQWRILMVYVRGTFDVLIDGLARMGRLVPRPPVPRLAFPAPRQHPDEPDDFADESNETADIAPLMEVQTDRSASTPTASSKDTKKTSGITALKPRKKAKKATEKDDNPELPMTGLGYQLPPAGILQAPDKNNASGRLTPEQQKDVATQLLSVLEDFGVRGEIKGISPGPVVTLFELEPAPGTKTSRVIGLSDDTARSMSAISVRVAVVPGRNAIGIELPNDVRETVFLRQLLESRNFAASKAKLPLALGKTIAGDDMIVDLARMPHLLVAGTTGSGKSVSVNCMILSLLYKLPPEKCRLIMIDPKMLELSVYEGIPHLLAPVVTEPTKAVLALRWAVREMEDRYRAMSKLHVRNIEGYNQRIAQARKSGEVLVKRVQTGFDSETGKPVFEEQPIELVELPLIVIIVDEFADLMLVAGKEIEAAVQRLAQKARAAGLHLIMATQRPSVDVVTGTIKANFPTRISFQVTSKIDSRTILGEGGAEDLLGMGDMLYMAGGGRTTRVHGPFVADEEVEEVVDFLRQQGAPDYVEAVTEEEEDFGGYSEADLIGGGALGGNREGGDDLFDQAVAIVASERKASTSFIQRQLNIGYNRAAKIIERMEKEGMISAANHVGKREILMPKRGEE